MGTTASGLPYPEAADPVANGATAIKTLADALDPRPRGLLARNVQSTSVDAGTAGATILTTVVTLPSQRWVKIHAQVYGQQLTAATGTIAGLIYANGAQQQRFLLAGPGGVAVNETRVENGDAYFLAPSGTFTADVRLSSISAGAFRVSANYTFLTIEDVGKQF